MSQPTLFPKRALRTLSRRRTGGRLRKKGAASLRGFRFRWHCTSNGITMTDSVLCRTWAGLARRFGPFRSYAQACGFPVHTVAFRLEDPHGSQIRTATRDDYLLYESGRNGS